MSRGPVTRALVRHARLVLWAALLVAPAAAVCAEPWTLERVLEEARSANARLPLARADVQIGGEAVRGARASLGPSVSLGGDLRYAPPATSYNPAVAPINEERIQIIAQQPVYDGGELDAKVRSSEALLRSARARYRVAERDLELEVRTRYAELIERERELGARRTGLDRLRSYLALVRQVMASGHGQQADLLRTRTRLSSEEANVTELERRIANARLELNDVMGRDPSAPLELAPLPTPSPPSPTGDEPWRAAPEVAQTEAEHEAARAGIAETRAARAPHLVLWFDTGLFGPGLPVPGVSPTLASRLRDDLGASITLSLTWPLWDLGVYDARLTAARLGAQQAADSIRVARRQARLAWERARADLAILYRGVEIRGRTIPTARDAWVLAESLYRGGAATALEVLDAHAALVDAEVAEAVAVQQYRVAEAQALRWGEP